MVRIAIMTMVLGMSWAWFGNVRAQVAERYSLRRVLIGLEDGRQPVDLPGLLAQEAAFFPYDAGARLKGQRWYLAWVDPQALNAPQKSSDVNDLLERLRQAPGIAFAEPFLVGDGGAEVGLTNEIYVQLGPGADPEAIAERIGALEVVPAPYLTGWWKMHLPPSRSTTNIDAALFLQQFSDVQRAEPNLLYQLSVQSNDPLYIRQWSLENTGALIQGNGTAGADMSVPEAWAVTRGRPEVRIVIVDSGVDTTHADLKDNLQPGFDATGGGSGGFPNTTYPSDGHGTACAGIAAARADNGVGIAGVCPECSVVPVKLFTYLFNPFGAPLPFATGGDMAAAIGWAWQDGGGDVISNSWGLTDPLLGALPDGTGIVEAALDLALDSARNGSGIPMLFSSGNEGDPPIWPGRRAGLISVNATSPCDERKSPTSCDFQNWAGNWGDSLDVAAPGVAIASTDMSGGNGYDAGDYTNGFGGTSAACPNAAGVMGLILSVDPGLSGPMAKALLEGSCDKVGGYTYAVGYPNGSWSPELGYGRVNALAAVQAATLVEVPEVASPVIRGFQVYPQPAGDWLAVEYTLAGGGLTEISLLDAHGRMVGHLYAGKEASGSYAHQFDLDRYGLANGFYVLKVKSSDQLAYNKLLIYK